MNLRQTFCFHLHACLVISMCEWDPEQKRFMAETSLERKK